MADKERLFVDGKDLSNLRVVDLKKELEKRGLSKSGSKKDLHDRLKSQLQLEKLREEASESQGEDEAPSVKMSEHTSPFIQQYMMKREQLLKKSQEEKRRVQEEKMRRESESQTSASEPEDTKSGLRSPDPVNGSSVTDTKCVDKDVEKSKKNVSDDVSKEVDVRSGGDALSVKQHEQQDTTVSKRKLSKPADKSSIDDEKPEKQSDKESPDKSDLHKTSEKAKLSENKPSEASASKLIAEESSDKTEAKDDTDDKKERHSLGDSDTTKPLDESSVQKQEAEQQVSRKSRRLRSSSPSDLEKVEVKKAKITEEAGEQEMPPSKEKNTPEKTEGTTEKKRASFEKEKKDSEKVLPQERIDKGRRDSRKRSQSSRSGSSESDSSEEESAEKSPEVVIPDRSRSRSSSASSRSSSSSSSSGSKSDSDSDTESEADLPAKSSVQRTSKAPPRRFREIQIEAQEDSFHTAAEDMSMTEDTKDTSKEKPMEQDPAEEDQSERKEDDSAKEAAKLPRPPRKRRWGSTRANKKTSINVSTQLLKESGIIADMKTEIMKTPEPVLELDVKEDMESAEESEEDAKVIRRTVTQDVKEDQRMVVTTSDGDQAEQKMESDDVEVKEAKVQQSESEEEEEEEHKVTVHKQKVHASTKEPKIIRQFSKQPSLPADEPKKVKMEASPSRRPASNIIHVRNLVRPFTVGQLKQVLGKFGVLKQEGGFWMDKIKSNCVVAFEKEEDAVAARNSLHGTKWPLSNPKILTVDFTSQKNLDHYLEKDRPPPRAPDVTEEPPRKRPPVERERKKSPPKIREWDRDKIRQSRSKSPERPVRRRASAERRSRERRERREQREKSRERKRKEKKAVEEEVPAKLLDDLFRKTKTTPCIYWLPLTEEQHAERIVEKKRRLEMREEQRKQREKEEEEQRQQRIKEREQRIREREKERRQNRSRSDSRRRGRRSDSRENSPGRRRGR